jgi:type II secretory pathway predicted ATPase ExeA
VPDVPRVVVPSARAARPAELFQAILFDLTRPYEGLSEQELRLAVTGLLLEAATTGPYPTVLVLDEAHHIADEVIEELRLLGNLETRSGLALFAVLVAGPALRERLALPSLEPFAQRLAARASIEPLSIEESAEYIRHQISSAGGEPGKLITAEAVALLADGGRGIPRLINRAATLAFELAATGEANEVDAEAVLEALDRTGLAVPESVQAAEPADPVFLPHPARAVEPARSRRRKSAIPLPGDEAGSSRATKDKPSRKRSA